jgi:LmbE family N-acetylglucosaminyl deacetylase
MDGSGGLMCVLAHPDDESLALGGTLAAYAARGVATSLVMATRGERGWSDSSSYPGPDALGRMREKELRAAARILGIRDLVFLDQLDGDLALADQDAVLARIVAEIRRLRPAVVVTFGPDGVYGHPDHIAISQLTTTAIVSAADASYADPSGARPHRVDKLYYRVWTTAESTVYQSVFGAVGIDVEGTRREWVSWPDWLISARLDTTDHWATIRDAVACHQSQISYSAPFAALDAAGHRRLWRTQQFYRVKSTVACAPGIERDLFAGLREGQRLAPAGPAIAHGLFALDGYRPLEPRIPA